MNFLEFKNKVHGPKKEKMSGDRLYCLERNISVRISWFIYKFLPFVRPNHVTGLSFFILFLVFSANFLPAEKGSAYLTIIQLILLYFITITDKIDGELSRAKNHITQSGMYYDYTVHLLYPFIFYFTIGHYFYILSNDYKIFYLTLLLGTITIILISLRTTKFFIYQEIRDKKIEIKDLIAKKTGKKISWPFPIRFLYHLTFLIYAWTLFFYIGAVYLSIYDFSLSFIFYKVHIFYTLLFLLYNILWHQPRKKMLKKI